MTLQYAQTKRAWSLEEGFHQEHCEIRIVEHLVGRAFVRKLGHKKHGQTQEFHIRQTAQRMQADAEFLKAAVKEMQTKWPLLASPDMAGIPAFAEKFWGYQQKKSAKKVRNMQKKSRRINRD